MTSGIHHVTAITRDVQANFDFYTGFLGLQLVKQTAGFEDPDQLHLFYGDAAGSPGSLVTFLVWQDGTHGRVGLGQVTEIALAVPPASIGNWLTRALAAHVPVEGPLREFGETVLRLKDPDGIIVKLVGLDLPATAPLPDADAPTRLRAVTILTDQAEAGADFLAAFGYRPDRHEGAIRRLVSDRDAVDIRDVSGFPPGIAGTGIIDHVAFRAPDADAVRAMQHAFHDRPDSNIHDRKYFHSLYLRDPGGVLIEYASDGPGMSVDEAPEALGRTLFLPQAGDPDALRARLPQFARPGEAHLPRRDLHFIHRFHHPDRPDGSTIILLHGTGGDEADLMPLAARINPCATLLGVRGRSTEEGIFRWFRRYNAVEYDQDDIRAEAEAFAAFVADAIRAYGLDPERMVFLGYSNGANLLAAVLQLHPGVLKQAVLLRAVQALDDPPGGEVGGARVLMLTGEDDPFARKAPPLVEALKAGGADLTAQQIPAGHQLVAQDLDAIRDWYRAG